MLKPIIEFNYFGINIYQLMAVIGVIFSVVLFLKRLKKAEYTEKQETIIIFVCLGSALFGLLMANVTNWIFMPELFVLPLLKRIESAGFNFYGGILSFLLLTFILSKIFKIDSQKLLNQIVPSVLIFHAFGRLGCSLAGCCYGIELHDYPLVEHTHLELFPAREIESIVLFIMALIFKKKNFQNALPLYFLSYGTLRFILEFFRGDYRGHLLNANWSPAQVISTVLVLCATVYFCLEFYKKKSLGSENDIAN
ncbi:MAG: prolipoprotein diacylglyceryl transferase family protein [Bacilli bacterium]|jgi:phosphatidylglycerol:prolipoprotein diacylglycerol transferase|nr:prolipoprotein diacylglyceryl transferase [Acholeplasmataceae bacterium]